MTKQRYDEENMYIFYDLSVRLDSTASQRQRVASNGHINCMMFMRKNMRGVKLGERRCPDVSRYRRRFYTDLDLNALCGGWRFSFLVFIHAFMSYKVQRNIVGLSDKKGS